MRFRKAETEYIYFSDILTVEYISSIQRFVVGLEGLGKFNMFRLRCSTSEGDLTSSEEI
jgi:hypothetical protein